MSEGHRPDSGASEISLHCAMTYHDGKENETENKTKLRNVSTEETIRNWQIRALLAVQSLKALRVENKWEQFVPTNSVRDKAGYASHPRPL